ncbi:MAG: Cell division protein FtsH [uncultured Solirubrobacteraceae bacterium]|uniref:Cell division protein FtsH n=1 Tax=uncultured Solirubrobacteraceae bacterium TaxID=1162706 RepID=A0A6J4SQB7_9ACTN|nr:MAG: Cell division protein FtsH [uncultured Solirubrobacteraceae bacterium]
MKLRPNRTKKRGSAEEPKRRLNTPGFWVSLIAVVLLIAYVQVLVASRPHPTGERIDFSTFVDLAEGGDIRRATVLGADNYVEGVYRRRGDAVAFNTPFLDDAGADVVEILSSNQIPLRIEQQYIKSVLPELSVLLPGLLTVLIFGYVIIGWRTGTGLFNQRSGSRRATAEDTTLRYDDIAAQDTAVAELREISQFLRDPERYARLGARIPKGVLLYGPPGCGKTLLARAVAGESGATFFSISGSDFVEMFVGVGAARVRELFREARESAPAIVFIDEIDAVARKRQTGVAGKAGSDEQNQALNQLLTEMDGFARETGTIVIGATNRPDDLDAALLRPGRFDRTVSVDRPDEAGRRAILSLHARGKPLAADVDLAAIASRAIGFTGADLESVTNEAALLAARSGDTEIRQVMLSEALTRILEAPERQRRLTMRDRTMGQQSLGSERVTFANVAGIGETLTELTEIRDFLRDPSRFTRMGARFPQGFLLVGPPGCGKTLLARAVAGESNAAFLAVAATEFVEGIVGEGSGRVRDLFGQARAMAPSIVFIDEIDAIGARRDSEGHGEREQTLNQILIELDGFRPRDGVIIMAATNRPEILDPALVRSGRFDRAITVDLPDRNGRAAILEVHIGNKRLASDVDLGAIAGITRGLSGADLANVMNEAALLSARRNGSEITMAAMEEAVERATMGIARAHVLTDAERRVVAVHEAGHVVVARTVPEGRLPHMVSMNSSGGTLARAWLTDTHDRVVHSKSALLDEMAILLGGRSAEELVFGEAGSSASGDLAQVGRIAHHMVRDLGMSDALGPIGYAGETDDDGRFVAYSEETAGTIDAEARKLVLQAQSRADRILTASRDTLDRTAAALLDAETLTAQQLEQLAGGPARTPA